MKFKPSKRLPGRPKGAKDKKPQKLLPKIRKTSSTKTANGYYLDIIRFPGVKKHGVRLPELLENLGYWMLEWRLGYNITIREMAMLCGVHWVSIHRFEKGLMKPTTATAGKILRAMTTRRHRTSARWHYPPSVFLYYPDKKKEKK